MERRPEIQELPRELVYEILADLPVKSLGRCRCVCKQWNIIISSSDFQQEHYHRQCQQEPLLLIASTGGGVCMPEIMFTPPETLDISTRNSYSGEDINGFSIPYPLLPSSDCLCAIQCCQGLVSVSFLNETYVCNPVTREIITLPPIEGEGHCVGFGYAAATKEFKVIRLGQYFGNKNDCEIFTLGTSNWRKLTCPFPDSFSDTGFHAPFLHGAIHFICNELKPEDAIYALDIESEESAVIPFPDHYYNHEGGEDFDIFSFLCLNDLRGFLSLTISFDNRMDIFMLKDYDNRQWVREYAINIPLLNYDFMLGHPLAILGDGTILLKIFEESSNGKLFWYNHRGQTLTESQMENYTATMYVESLQSPVNLP